MANDSVRSSNGVLLENPRWLNTLFSSSNWAWLWLMVRLWLGLNWLQAGWHKVSAAAWTGGGMAVKGYWERAGARRSRPRTGPSPHRLRLVSGVPGDVDQWIRMLAATALALIALSSFDGVLQILVCALAVVLAAITEKGVLFFSKR